MDTSFSTSSLSRSRVARLRLLARARRRYGALFLFVPTLGVVGFDFALRADRLARLDALHRGTYALAVLESLVVWSLLLAASSRRNAKSRWVARVAFVFFFTIALGGQAYFFEQYSAYLNVDVSRFATNFVESVLNQLWADAPHYAAKKIPALVLALSLAWIGSIAVRPQRTAARRISWAALVAFVAALFLPTHHSREQASTPDVLYLNAMGGMIRTQLGLTEQSHQLRPRPRKSLPVPQMTRAVAAPRNVVFVILESVRADATCVDFDPKCERTGATNRLFPKRVPLRQLRALDSSTAISLAVLWSGVGPHESREVLHTWPLLFDYAKAAGYYTAFWTSQNMMFGNVRLWVENLHADSFFHGTEVDPTSDIDLGAPESLFADRALSEMKKLEEPFFVTIQLSNGHYPYFVDEAGPQPFQPAEMSKAPEDNQKFFNFYQNAVHQQDRHLARILGALRAAPFGARTVVVYTSDHGEAFREHHQMGHTFSVFDEEVKVPGFVDAPPGTLSAAEEAALASKSDAYVFHPDLTATVIDLLGVWNDPGIARYREKILGESLLSERANERALPMTNCAGVWSCAFENWGFMRGPMKLEARAWDPEYRCFDLAKDPLEQTDLGPAACGDLKARAGAVFHRLPGK